MVSCDCIRVTHSWPEHCTNEMSFWGFHIWWHLIHLSLLGDVNFDHPVKVLLVWFLHCSIRYVSPLQLMIKNMQISCSSSQFPYRFNILWCFLSDPVFTKMLAKCQFSNSGLPSIFICQPLTFYYNFSTLLFIGMTSWIPIFSPSGS